MFSRNLTLAFTTSVSHTVENLSVFFLKYHFFTAFGRNLEI